MKICVIGNSAALKIRPPRANAAEKTYSEILEAAGHHVRNVSRAGVTLQEAFGLLEDDVITFFPDAVIVHHGVVEVCYRRTIRKWNNAAIPNMYLNAIFQRGYQFDDAPFRAINFVRRGLNWATKTAARIAGGKWQWQKPQDFVRVVEETCKLILKETGARVLVVGITPCSSRVERILPGSGDEILRTNQLLRTLCQRFGERASFVETESWMTEADLPRLAPDGIHFSADGHALLAKRILSALA